MHNSRTNRSVISFIHILTLCQHRHWFGGYMSKHLITSILTGGIWKPFIVCCKNVPPPSLVYNGLFITQQKYSSFQLFPFLQYQKCLTRGQKAIICVVSMALQQSATCHKSWAVDRSQELQPLGFAVSYRQQQCTDLTPQQIINI